MTNKLPEVGKRYKYKSNLVDVSIGEIEVLRIDSLGKVWYYFCNRVYEEAHGKIQIPFEHIQTFWQFFEEAHQCDCAQCCNERIEESIKSFWEELDLQDKAEVSEVEKAKEEKMRKSSVLDYFKELPEDKAEEVINAETNSVTKKSLETEIKPETQSHISELSPEVKEAMEELRRELRDAGFPQIQRFFLTDGGKTQALLNALDKQFKVNETSESVDVKKEEVNRKSGFLWSETDVKEWREKTEWLINSYEELKERAEKLKIKDNLTFIEEMIFCGKLISKLRRDSRNRLGGISFNKKLGIYEINVKNNSDLLDYIDRHFVEIERLIQAFEETTQTAKGL